MTQNLPTLDLYKAGQSPWLDYISRELLNSGTLKALIDRKNLMGVTSNPSIFEKAMGTPGGGYDADIRKMLAKGNSIFEIYDALAISDIRRTCDLFLPVYKKTKGGHGFVSLEVAPGLAYETEKTLAEAKRLHKAVNRPNIMIKIPATAEGIPAIRAAIAEGISINVTLMFSLKHYQDVAHAYIDGLKAYKAKGGDLSRVHSVASVFVSRIDTLVDKKLDEMGNKSLKGKAAIANSKVIYQEFKKIFGGEAFKKLERQGAQVQKVLWGSTSCKNPAYSDLVYVETLVGPDTVNTMPQPTLEALLHHGKVRPGTIEEDLKGAETTVAELKKLGFDLIQIGEKLQKDGVMAFIDSFDALMKTLEKKRFEYLPAAKKPRLASVSYSLEPRFQSEVTAEVRKFQNNEFLSRFFKLDPTIWKSDEGHCKVIDNRLGWLSAHEWISGKMYEIDQLKQDIEADGIKDIVLLGMGGSSLAPEVMSLICRSGKKPGFRIVDTTDAESIAAVEKEVSLKSSLFIVASKSGGTIETTSQYLYFYDRVAKLYGAKGKSLAGKHFIAITDEGSALQNTAKEKNFRKTFINPSNIGGRYSALSLFGMVPAGLMGIDARRILDSAALMYSSTRNHVELENNPAVFLGIVLGILARLGRDKLTLLASPKLESFGAWLEQLIAESTGKEGKGIIPVDGEGLLPAKSYGADRAFLVLSLKGEKAVDAKALSALKKFHPVIEVRWPEPAAIGSEFLGWEIVTAVASAVLGINPFDEPNVKESKDITGKLLQEFKDKGKLQEPESLVSGKHSLDLKSFLKNFKQGGYAAFLSYTERSKMVAEPLNRIRRKLATYLQAPVLLGYGPRYLHSIGQLYKGGPRTGFFIEFISREKKEIPVPGAGYGFGQLKRAQAFGDMLALQSKGLPVMGIDLGKDWEAGLKAFEQQLDQLTGK